MVTCHFHDDHECSHRGLHDPGKISCHPEYCGKRYARPEQGTQSAPQARANSKRRRENSARYARKHRQKSRGKFGYEKRQWKRMALNGAARLIIPCPKSCTAGRETNDGNAKTKDPGKQ